MTVWVASDLHFNHKNIAKYCPYRQTKSWIGEPTDESVQEMNELIILNWNSVIARDDEVWILGDVAMGRIEFAPKLITRLNGKKYLVKGNHDRTLVKHVRVGEYEPAVRDLFEGVYDLWVLNYKYKDEKVRIFMCHYPMLQWDDSDFHLHGHLHSPPEKCVDPEIRRMDIGIDGNYLFPRKLDDVLKILSSKKQQRDRHDNNL